MTIRTLTYAAAAVIIGATAAHAQSVSCTRDTVFAGGGAFNFTCKPVEGQSYAANYCIPYLSVNAPPVPRGGADAINGWANVVNNHTSLTFTDIGAASAQVCGTPGSHQVQGVGSNN
jgi:hypothetical protein